MGVLGAVMPWVTATPGSCDACNAAPVSRASILLCACAYVFICACVCVCVHSAIKVNRERGNSHSPPNQPPMGVALGVASVQVTGNFPAIAAASAGLVSHSLSLDTFRLL